MTAIRLMLGRRPKGSAQQQAFGHVALNTGAQQEVDAVVLDVANRALSSKPITYDPDDAPQAGEVMTQPLNGIDKEFQPAAPWSLERAATAIAKQGKPVYIGKAEIVDGGWTFYALRSRVQRKVATVVRATSPTRALKHGNRVISQFVGGELRPMKHPLVGIDYDADAVILDDIVYIFRPQRLEQLLIDAEEIRSRAPQIVAKFAQGLAAPLSTATATWVEKACSHNSNVGRRVERLNRTAALSWMTAAKLRAGMPTARLPKGAFGLLAVSRG